MSNLGFDTSRAACKGIDVEVFFPLKELWENRAYQKMQREATQICEQCEVKEPCLEYALANEPMGIWGGKTEFQRHILRKNRNLNLPSDRVLSVTLQNELRKTRPQYRRK